MKSYLVGSTYFFSCYSDFNSKDKDYIQFVNNVGLLFSRMIVKDGNHIFQRRKQNRKQMYIDLALKRAHGNLLGGFLVPEVCNEMGITVEDLPQLAPLCKALDYRHKYEQIIYESYIENGSFTLTEEQRLKAYESYKNSRKKTYSA